MISAAHASMSAIDGGRIRLAVAGLDPSPATTERSAPSTATSPPRPCAARERGIDIDAPFAADTLFMASKRGPGTMRSSHITMTRAGAFKQLAFGPGRERDAWPSDREDVRGPRDRLRHCGQKQGRVWQHDRGHISRVQDARPESWLISAAPCALPGPGYPVSPACRFRPLPENTLFSACFRS